VHALAPDAHPAKAPVHRRPVTRSEYLPKARSRLLVFGAYFCWEVDSLIHVNTGLPVIPNLPIP